MQQRYDFYICHSGKDRATAEAVREYLISNGLRCCMPLKDLIAEPFLEQIQAAIRDSEGTLVLISESSLQSPFVFKEVAFAIDYAKGRNKLIVPLILDDASMDIRMQFLLGDRQQIAVRLSDPDWLMHSLDPVIADFTGRQRKALLYEEYQSLRQSQLPLEASGKLVEIVNLLLEQVNPGLSLRAQYRLMIEVDQCLEQLHALYDDCDGDYSAKARQVAQAKLDMLKKLGDLLRDVPEEPDDPFFAACMIRLIYWDREVRWDCVDMITHGDVGQGIVYTLPKDEYARRQEKYRAMYLQTARHAIADQPQAVKDFIEATKDYLYDRPSTDKNRARSNPVVLANGDEKLEAIAKYMRQTNELFEIISQDHKAAAFLKCLITSYERLKGYCEEIHARELTAECIARISVLKQQYMQISDESPSDQSIAEKGIRALLGLARSGSGSFDVFLSHESFDTDIANGVYRFLRSNLMEVFYDRISLPELSKAEYKLAILQALDRSRHFVVVASACTRSRPAIARMKKTGYSGKWISSTPSCLRGAKRAATSTSWLPMTSSIRSSPTTRKTSISAGGVSI